MPSRFLNLLERERDWFEVLIHVGLIPGEIPAHHGRLMHSERSHWLRN